MDYPMAYLTATRYGLRKLDHIPEYLTEAGWTPGWQDDATEMRAMRMPGLLGTSPENAEPAWVVMDRDWNVLSGWSSSLRAAARKIERLAGND